MTSRPPTADAGSGSAGMSPAEFDQALREATASSQRALSEVRDALQEGGSVLCLLRWLK